MSADHIEPTPAILLVASLSYFAVMAIGALALIPWLFMD